MLDVARNKAAGKGKGEVTSRPPEEPHPVLVCMGEGGRLRLLHEYALAYCDKDPPDGKPAHLSRDLGSYISMLFQSLSQKLDAEALKRPEMRCPCVSCRSRAGTLCASTRVDSSGPRCQLIRDTVPFSLQVALCPWRRAGKVGHVHVALRGSHVSWQLAPEELDLGTVAEPAADRRGRLCRLSRRTRTCCWWRQQCVARRGPVGSQRPQRRRLRGGGGTSMFITSQ